MKVVMSGIFSQLNFFIFLLLFPHDLATFLARLAKGLTLDFTVSQLIEFKWLLFPINFSVISVK